ncbi:PIN domain-containing protein [Candidatus Kaiserbacteria bacterium]|nr:PIN domain-containing protein [Candidatus Kaiserbacteria bacterium]
MYYLVDSSVWVALFLDDDSQHAKAVEVMSKIEESRIHVMYGVVLEVASILERKQSKDLANKFIEYVLDKGFVTGSMVIARTDMQTFLHESDRLSFVDVLLKDVALKQGWALVSFDTKLLKSLEKAQKSP